jgi:hypothetical protein
MTTTQIKTLISEKFDLDKGELSVKNKDGWLRISIAPARLDAVSYNQVQAIVLAAGFQPYTYYSEVRDAEVPCILIDRKY